MVKGEIFIDGILKTAHELEVFYVEDYVIAITF